VDPDSQPTDVRTEYWSPTPAVVPAGLSLPRLLENRVRAHPDSVFAEVKDQQGGFVPVTVSELARDVLTVARGLVASGVEPGGRVAIMGRTRYEWTVADFAVLSVGAVVVPVYETSSPAQVREIVGRARVELAIVETEDLAAPFRTLFGSTALRRVVTIEGHGDTLVALEDEGAAVADEVVAERAHACTPETTATIVFTSGTTGAPKGAVLTHSNLVTHMINGVDDPHFSVMIKGQDKRLLLFLPLAHAFARYIVVACLYAECIIGYEPDMSDIVEDLGRFRPTWLLAVPRVFETVYNQAGITAGAGFRHRVFEWAADTSVAYSRSIDAGGPSPWLRLRHRVARALVLDKITAVLGGRVRYAISGSAPMDVGLAHFFRGLGVIVMQGYGLTESSAPTTCELPGLVKIGTVGPPYPGTGVRIASGGEVLVKGPNVFQGYLDDPEATRQVMTPDGWLRTGDLGRLDADGYLTITGRQKDLIVTAGGKNVQPEPLENAIRSNPLVSEVVVVGDGRPFVAALISLDLATTRSWLESQGVHGVAEADMAAHPAVRGELQHAVDAANAHVSRAESVRAFRVSDRPFAIDEGEISSSQKARRSVIVEHFADQIDQLYERAARDRRAR